MILPKSAAELESTVNQILNIIRAQYVIGYKPGPAVDKGFRKIAVSLVDTAGSGKAVVKTRAGYLMPDKTPER